ncbi:Hpt domain-containing protein [Paucibacter soli]|uniref:Hpt domain-containing protein n=1 Tax=Paucibacter soli TaxID=3133433 RepID=UPI00309F536F
MNAIDHQIFTELQDSAGADFVGELVQTFLEDAPSLLQALRQALADADAAAFRRAAHTLKSNGNTFGALGLAELARELEQRAQQPLAPGDAELRARLQALETAYEHTAKALQGISHA